ncbi:MAG TPA: FAD:protein FMN transferase [Vicinamibacterales bacterium]|nr:FAD:protein FMN transferase [Vicinamibacterales bacterium]
MPRPIVSFFLLVSVGIAPQQSLQRYEAVEPHMGTLVKITLYTSDEQSATTAFRAAFDRIAELDRILSDYKPDSELNQLTSHAVGHAVPVSNDLCTVLAASQELAAATRGAFDITQGPVIRLWRAARAEKRVPDPAALKEAASRSGFRKLHVDVRQRTVMLDQAGMALDVGAIGKGYAASESLAVLRARGIRSGLVAVSGDLAFGDAPPGRNGWRIDIHNGDPELAGVPPVLELTNAAVSTSGPSEQHLDVDGRRYSHVIDPASQIGLLDDITVTVIARSGLDADGLDTAVSLIGRDRGLSLIESRSGAAALIVQRGKAGVVASMSSRFRKLAAASNGSIEVAPIPPRIPRPAGQ